MSDMALAADFARVFTRGWRLSAHSTGVRTSCQAGADLMGFDRIVPWGWSGRLVIAPVILLIHDREATRNAIQKNRLRCPTIAVLTWSEMVGQRRLAMVGWCFCNSGGWFQAPSRPFGACLTHPKFTP